jgi:hypothetical protein
MLEPEKCGGLSLVTSQQSHPSQCQHSKGRIKAATKLPQPTLAWLHKNETATWIQKPEAVKKQRGPIKISAVLLNPKKI